MFVRTELRVGLFILFTHPFMGTPFKGGTTSVPNTEVTVEDNKKGKCYIMVLGC